MSAEHDVVERALKLLLRMTRARRWGGMVREYRLAQAALAEYERRKREPQPRQLQLLQEVGGGNGPALCRDHPIPQDFHDANRG